MSKEIGFQCGGCGKEFKTRRAFAIHRSRCPKKWKQNHPTPDKVLFISKTEGNNNDEKIS